VTDTETESRRSARGKAPQAISPQNTATVNYPATDNSARALTCDEARQSFFEQHWLEMTPLQREQCRVLVALLRDLRIEVEQRAAERNAIAFGEPCLQPPRSSLNPMSIVEGDHA
jgi:hypothetical protein